MVESGAIDSWRALNLGLATFVCLAFIANALWGFADFQAQWETLQKDFLDGLAGFSEDVATQTVCLFLGSYGLYMDWWLGESATWGGNFLQNWRSALFYVFLAICAMGSVHVGSRSLAKEIGQQLFGNVADGHRIAALVAGISVVVAVNNVLLSVCGGSGNPGEKQPLRDSMRT